ncbi:MAG: crossover junction endodeoxyribonuclease RuvC [Clostridiales bacterium]|jgi:crossover junction endodeoxyribonuclease RuvC|nr:crossover junction endodeoxyribonuclease RuvC [Clostridiales bacterium]
MIILGIDPGLAILGFGIIEKSEHNLTLIAYGTVTTPQYESTPVRLAMIDQKITDLIAKYNPSVVAVEELFFNTNVTTGIKVAQSRGVVLVSAIKHCGHLYEYTPLQVKMALTGNGRADKKQVQYMVKAILNLDSIPRPDDAADAIAVAICHANTSQFDQREIK